MWRRAFRSLGRWLDDRTGITSALGPILRHPVPPKTGWWYVFGSATLIAFLLQVVTGVFLAGAYVPSAGQAYDSLKFISERALFGRTVRGLHYFGASAMVLLVGIHAIRTFLMGAFKYPREMNWLSGVFLLLFTVLMGFTGQLLRWDQNAVWSVVVGAQQAGRAPGIGRLLAEFTLGGRTLGAATLSRFFAIHVFIVPALIFGVLGLHLYLVVRHGISEPPVAGRRVDRAGYRAWYHDLLAREGRPFWPDAAWRDAIFGVLMIAGVLILALTVGPPKLGQPPDPTIIEAYPRPDWYLLWYFAVLALLPPGSESYVIVLAPLAIGLVLLLVPVWNHGERSIRRRPWSALAVVAIVVMVGSLWIAGERAQWSPQFDPPPLPAAVTAHLPPAAQEGARLFHVRGCESCHRIAGQGGRRGPDLSDVGARLSPERMTLILLRGEGNMPGFASILSPAQTTALIEFLRTRR